MIIEPSLMPVIENLLTNPKYEDSYLEGMCELVKDKKALVGSESKSLVYVIRPDLS